MGDDPTEELLKEIASKHGVALDREDPILIVQTMHARLLAESTAAQQTLLEDYRKTLEAMLERWGAETKAKAERIVTASLTASTEAMKKQMGDSATEAGNAIRKEMTGTLAQVAGQLRSATRIGYINLLAAVVTFLTAVVVYWTLHP
jgi:CHASE3 domain sensor protein